MLEGAKSALTVRELPSYVFRETSAEQQKYRRVRFLCRVGLLVVKKEAQYFIIVLK